VTLNVITGGAGFIGCNVAERLLGAGERVLLLDNLSRPNVYRNVAWLRQKFGARSELCVGDVREGSTVHRAIEHADHVFHFAAQVAVTTSLESPREDFDVNAGGTLRVLEAVRARKNPPSLFFTSTNKVYGALDWLALERGDGGYTPQSDAMRAHGISESAPLDFHSPYGCSKGCGDQYVLDYARSFGLRTVVFRMSCIYGPRQFGTEDQGWVAHLMLRALRGEPISIYGDGHQVRDLLFVGDLVDAFMAARRSLPSCAGQAFNLGGGPDNAVSVLSVLERIADSTARAPRIGFHAWRTGDQRYYVSDTRKFSAATGWRPRVPVADGMRLLMDWLREADGLSAPSPADSGVDAQASSQTTSNGALSPLPVERAAS
jgi:CDP-paratose 2-epimerase